MHCNKRLQGSDESKGASFRSAWMVPGFQFIGPPRIVGGLPAQFVPLASSHDIVWIDRFLVEMNLKHLAVFADQEGRAA